MLRRGKYLVRSLLLRLGIVAVVVLLSGLICATLVRFAPGFGAIHFGELTNGPIRLQTDSAQSLGRSACR